MAFSRSSQDIALNNGVLSAECQRSNGSWDSSSIPLDDFLGNIDGTFQWGYRAVTQSSRNLRIEGHVLKGSLRNEREQWVDASLDLDSNLKNDNGTLTPDYPPMHEVSFC